MYLKQLHFWSKFSASCYMWISGLAFGISVPLTTNALHSNQWVSLYKLWNSCSWIESMRNLELKWPCICILWYFQQILFYGSKWRWKVFHLWNGVDSSWNLIPWTVIWIWCYNVTVVRMLLLTLTLSSPDFLPMHYFIQIKPYIP